MCSLSRRRSRAAGTEAASDTREVVVFRACIVWHQVISTHCVIFCNLVCNIPVIFVLCGARTRGPAACRVRTPWSGRWRFCDVDSISQCYVSLPPQTCFVCNGLLLHRFVVHSGTRCARLSPDGCHVASPAPSAPARPTVAEFHNANTLGAFVLCLCVTGQCERMRCRRRSAALAANCFARSVGSRARAGARAH